jgi:hypothetical protein
LSSWIAPGMARSPKTISISIRTSHPDACRWRPGAVQGRARTRRDAGSKTPAPVVAGAKLAPHDGLKLNGKFGRVAREPPIPTGQVVCARPAILNSDRRWHDLRTSSRKRPGYASGRDRLDFNVTSRLSPHLRLAESVGDKSVMQPGSPLQSALACQATSRGPVKGVKVGCRRSHSPEARAAGRIAGRSLKKSRH